MANVQPQQLNPGVLTHIEVGYQSFSKNRGGIILN